MRLFHGRFLFSEPFKAHRNISLEIEWRGRDRQRQPKVVIKFKTSIIKIDFEFLTKFRIK